MLKIVKLTFTLAFLLLPIIGYSSLIDERNRCLKNIDTLIKRSPSAYLATLKTLQNTCENLKKDSDGKVVDLKDMNKNLERLIRRQERGFRVSRNNILNTVRKRVYFSGDIKEELRKESSKVLDIESAFNRVRDLHIDDVNESSQKEITKRCREISASFRAREEFLSQVEREQLEKSERECLNRADRAALDFGTKSNVQELPDISLEHLQSLSDNTQGQLEELKDICDEVNDSDEYNNYSKSKFLKKCEQLKLVLGGDGKRPSDNLFKEIFSKSRHNKFESPVLEDQNFSMVAPPIGYEEITAPHGQACVGQSLIDPLIFKCNEIEESLVGKDESILKNSDTFKLFSMISYPIVGRNSVSFQKAEKCEKCFREYAIMEENYSFDEELKKAKEGLLKDNFENSMNEITKKRSIIDHYLYDNHDDFFKPATGQGPETTLGGREASKVFSETRMNLSFKDQLNIRKQQLSCLLPAETTFKANANELTKSSEYCAVEAQKNLLGFLNDKETKSSGSVYNNELRSKFNEKVSLPEVKAKERYSLSVGKRDRSNRFKKHFFRSIKERISDSYENLKSLCRVGSSAYNSSFLNRRIIYLLASGTEHVSSENLEKFEELYDDIDEFSRIDSSFGILFSSPKNFCDAFLKERSKKIYEDKKFDLDAYISKKYESPEARYELLKNMSNDLCGQNLSKHIAKLSCIKPENLSPELIDSQEPLITGALRCQGYGSSVLLQEKEQVGGYMPSRNFSFMKESTKEIDKNNEEMNSLPRSKKLANFESTVQKYSAIAPLDTAEMHGPPAPHNYPPAPSRDMDDNRSTLAQKVKSTADKVIARTNDTVTSGEDTVLSYEESERRTTQSMKNKGLLYSNKETNESISDEVQGSVVNVTPNKDEPYSYLNNTVPKGDNLFGMIGGVDQNSTASGNSFADLLKEQERELTKKQAAILQPIKEEEALVAMNESDLDFKSLNDDICSEENLENAEKEIIDLCQGDSKSKIKDEIAKKVAGKESTLKNEELLKKIDSLEKRVTEKVQREKEQEINDLKKQISELKSSVSSGPVYTSNKTTNNKKNDIAPIVSTPTVNAITNPSGNTRTNYVAPSSSNNGFRVGSVVSAGIGLTLKNIASNKNAVSDSGARKYSEPKFKKLNGNLVQLQISEVVIDEDGNKSETVSTNATSRIVEVKVKDSSGQERKVKFDENSQIVLKEGEFLSHFLLFTSGKEEDNWVDITDLGEAAQEEVKSIILGGSGDSVTRKPSSQDKPSDVSYEKLIKGSEGI